MHWPRRLITIGLTAMVLLSLAGAAGGESRSAPTEIDLDSLLRRVLETEDAPGAILGVRRDSGEIQVAAAGLADLESGRPMDVGDPYFLGSIAKVQTATVVLQLVEQGHLRLDQRLADFLPTFPKAEDVTIRQLLQHTSGIADVAVWIYFRPDRAEMLRLLTRDWRIEELIEAAAELEPDFEPGSEWAYSNTNYLLLGAIVEAITGDTLASQLRSRIYQPLGLTHTWLNRWERADDELPITGYLGPLPFWPHSEMFGELGPTTEIDQGNIEWGSGGVVSTAAEAIEFLDALLAGDLLDDGVLRQMMSWHETPALGSPDPGTPRDLESGYGLGIARQRRPGYTMVGHGGLYNGHTAGLWRLENCDTTVAFFVNRGFVDARRIMDAVAETTGCSSTTPD